MDNCPHCGVSLIGDPIPEDMREHYSPPYHWRREIGIEYPEKYDGVWEWQCPDCKGKWPSTVVKLKHYVCPAHTLKLKVGQVAYLNSDKCDFCHRGEG